MLGNPHAQILEPINAYDITPSVIPLEPPAERVVSHLRSILRLKLPSQVSTSQVETAARNLESSSWLHPERLLGTSTA